MSAIKAAFTEDKTCRVQNMIVVNRWNILGGVRSRSVVFRHRWRVACRESIAFVSRNFRFSFLKRMEELSNL